MKDGDKVDVFKRGYSRYVTPSTPYDKDLVVGYDYGKLIDYFRNFRENFDSIKKNWIEYYKNNSDSIGNNTINSESSVTPTSSNIARNIPKRRVLVINVNNHYSE